jgi:ATP-dependent RNA helicase DeaD
VSWDFLPVFDAEHRAAMEHGKPIVYVCPPAGWAIRPLFEALPQTDGPGLETLILAAEAGDVLDAAAALGAARPKGLVHPLTGLARTERLIRADAVNTLVATPADALYLLRRSVLKSEKLSRVTVLWPETIFATGASADLDTVLGDAAGAQRIIVTTDDSSVADFIERHARRAPIAVLSGIPERGVGSVRYAIVEPHARMAAARVVLDILSPKQALVWDPVPHPGWGWGWETLTAPDVSLISEVEPQPADLVIAADLPSAEALAACRKVGREVVVLLRPPQLAYLKRIAGEARPLRLPGHTDRVRTEAMRLRSELRKRLEHTDLTTALLAVEPLLDEYDPALIAAAALSGQGDTPSAPDVSEAPSKADTATWTKLFVTAGRRDDLGPGEILGAVLRAADLQPTDVGRIDVRESFSLVEVRPEVAEQTIRCLSGEKIRGRRVTARLDRHESSERSRSRRPDR